jgi:hypothetical protein
MSGYMGWGPEDAERWGDYGNWVGSLKDRAQARREERLRAAIKAQKAQLTPPPREVEQLPTGPASSVSSFQLYAPGRPKGQSARSARIDALIEKHTGRRQ